MIQVCFREIGKYKRFQRDNVSFFSHGNENWKRRRKTKKKTDKGEGRHIVPSTVRCAFTVFLRCFWPCSTLYRSYFCCLRHVLRKDFVYVQLFNLAIYLASYDEVASQIPLHRPQQSLNVTNFLNLYICFLRSSWLQICGSVAQLGSHRGLLPSCCSQLDNLRLAYVNCQYVTNYVKATQHEIVYDLVLGI